MRKGVVTVVLPIYNVEKYLERCLKSVVNQTYENLEIILVVDGSPDRCPEICEEWAKKDERIKVIQKKNAGLGMARNTGIENATGEYICFFDSDDYVALDTIEKAYHYISDNHADIVLFGFYTVDSDGRIKKYMVPHTEKTIYRETEVQSYILPNLISSDPRPGKKTNFSMSSCTCMYSMRLIKSSNWRFFSERQYISEDVTSLLFLYKDIKSVAVLPKALYFYCENKASLSHVYREDRYQKIKYCYDACQQICEELNYSWDIRERLASQCISNIISALKSIVSADISKKEKRQYLTEIVMDQHLQSIVRKMDIHKETWARKILLIAMRKKRCLLIYILVKLKS